MLRRIILSISSLLIMCTVWTSHIATNDIESSTCNSRRDECGKYLFKKANANRIVKWYHREFSELRVYLLSCDDLCWLEAIISDGGKRGFTSTGLSLSSLLSHVLQLSLRLYNLTCLVLKCHNISSFQLYLSSFLIGLASLGLLQIIFSLHNMLRFCFTYQSFLH
jgi:hypothetical protein